jgi:hypothetical protein
MASQVFRYPALALYLLSATVAHSQQPEPKPPAHTGSVTGFVTFTETHLPARFAEIRLVPKPTDTTATPNSAAPDADQPAGDKPERQPIMVAGISDMEGRFQLDGVPVGDYLAAAHMTGYLAPGAAADLNPTDEELKPIIASFPIVHVSEGQTVNLNLTLHRGGVITGRVLYSDGSPATGVEVSWEPPIRPTFNQTPPRPFSPLLQALRQFNDNTQSDLRAKADDQGRYRIFGLSPGKYIVDTPLMAQGFSARVVMNDGTGFGGVSPNRPFPNLATVYAPGVFRRTDARVFEIRGEEEITDADLKLDPSGLHSVKGRIVAGEDRHVPSQAMISIKENGKRLDRMSMLEPDGSFEVDYLPSGTYTLQIMGSPDMTTPTNPNDPPRPQRQYQMAEQAVIIETHDVILDEVVLAPLKPGEKLQFPQ